MLGAVEEEKEEEDRDEEESISTTTDLASQWLVSKDLVRTNAMSVLFEVEVSNLSMHRPNCASSGPK